MATALACASQDPGYSEQGDTGPAGEVQAAISGGSLVTSKYAPFSSIVKMGYKNSAFAAGEFFSGCSAFKLASRWYLTAHHCGFQSNVGSTVTVTNNRDGSGGSTHTISNVVVHPSTLALAANPLGFDLVMVQLDSDNGIPAIDPIYADQFPSESGTMVGYGCDDYTGTHSVRADGTYFDYAGGNNYKKQYATVTTVPYTTPPAGNPYAFSSNGLSPALCPGDSGAPFFKIVNGQYQMTGVNSAGGGGSSSFARTYGANAWIDAVRANLPGKNEFSDYVRGTFINLWSNYCLEANVSNGQSSILDGCYMAASNLQRYQAMDKGGGYYEFQNLYTGGCLAIANASIADAAPVTTVTCDGSDTTRWSISGTDDFRQVVNKKSGKCMHAQGTGVNAAIDQNVCQYTTDYFWVFSR